jgi:uncharacterized membrane protein YvbJ
MMNHCPQCGQKRIAEELTCPKCHCFYSQLDQLLAEQQAEIDKHSLAGHLKAIWQANNKQQALQQELINLKKNTPNRTKLTFIVIILFIFALMVTVI